jgi:curli biogenesis system outer membrane secretion channel CsgG
MGDFEVKTDNADSSIGLGLREILIKALIKSNRFNVVERKDENADLIVNAAVSEFEPQASGGRDGVGGGGGIGSGRLGGLLGAALDKAQVSLEIRVLEASTSKILGGTQAPIRGQASDKMVSHPTDALSNLSLVGGLAIYADTPMEKAIRVCISEAVRYISQSVPANYYKY